MRTVKHSQPVTYMCSPQVSYTVEDQGIQLIHCGTGKSQMLFYPEAALWDFFSRRLPMQRIVTMMAVIKKIDPDAVRSWILETLASWARTGWLTEKGKNG